MLYFSQMDQDGLSQEDESVNRVASMIATLQYQACVSLSCERAAVADLVLGVGDGIDEQLAAQVGRGGEGVEGGKSLSISLSLRRLSSGYPVVWVTPPLHDSWRTTSSPLSPRGWTADDLWTRFPTSSSLRPPRPPSFSGFTPRLCMCGGSFCGREMILDRGVKVSKKI